MRAWEGLNRRQFPRIDYPCLVVVRHSSGEENKNDTILTHTNNVGIGGVCVALKQDVPKFSEVNIELDLLDLDEHIYCAGKVVWNVERKNGDKTKQPYFDVGIEFVDIKAKDLSRLKKVISRLNQNR